MAGKASDLVAQLCLQVGLVFDAARPGLGLAGFKNLSEFAGCLSPKCLGVLNHIEPHFRFCVFF